MLICLAEIVGFFAQAVVVGLGHGNGILERVLDLEAEQPLDAPGEHAAADDEEQDGRNEREADEGRNQLGPELGAQDALLALEVQFPEAPCDHEDDGGQEQEVGVDQDEDEDVVGERAFKAPVLDLKDDRERRQDHKTEEIKQALHS